MLPEDEVVEQADAARAALEENEPTTAEPAEQAATADNDHPGRTELAEAAPDDNQATKPMRTGTK